jgi:hypothetical protein
MLWGGAAVAADEDVEAFVCCDETEAGRLLVPDP